MSTEKELGEALLKLEIKGLGTAVDAGRLANKIFKRDRRQMRVLGGLAILFSTLSGAAFYGMFDFLIFRTIPAVIRLDDRLNKLDAESSAEASGKNLTEKEPAEKARAKPQPAQASGSRPWYHSNANVTCVGIGLSAMFFLAVGTTVLLIFASRWAALRQINAGLLEISHQLRNLQSEKG